MVVAAMSNLVMLCGPSFHYQRGKYRVGTSPVVLILLLFFLKPFKQELADFFVLSLFGFSSLFVLIVDNKD